MSPAIPRLLLLALSLLGWGLFAREMAIDGLHSISYIGGDLGGRAVDTFAYWYAGSNLAAGEPLYWAEELDQLGAYLYPPPFAFAWAPISLVPEVFAEWGWRLLGVLCVRYMAGSWQFAGLWWIFPGSLTEITSGNVTLQLAAITVAGIRGHPAGILPSTLVKFGAIAVVPFLWLRRPGTRRGLLVGGAIAVGIVAVSFLLAPNLWFEYFDMLGRQSGAPFNPLMIHILPTPAADFALRAAIALALVVASVRWNSPHLAYVAAFLLTPTIWFFRFAVLLALPTLENDDRIRPYLWQWRKRDDDGEAATTPT